MGIPGADGGDRIEFLISACYRGTGRSAIFRFDANSCKLTLLRQDDYYEPGNPRMDYIYWGMDIHNNELYCVGGNVLSILNLDGDILFRKEESFLDIAHDIKVIDGQVYCTNTGHDTLEIFSTGFEHLKTIDVNKLHCFHNRSLVPKTSQNTDSLHLNFISVCDGSIFLTHSFMSKRDRLTAMRIALNQKLAQYGFRTRRTYGLYQGLTNGKVLDGGGVFTLSGDQVVSGLHGAHDGVFWGDKFYINSTYNIETLVYDKEFRLKWRVPFDVGMILRGLYPLDENTLLVGATCIDPTRFSAQQIYHNVLAGRGSTTFDDRSNIKIVDLEIGDVLEVISLEPYQSVHPEIFEIIPFVCS